MLWRRWRTHFESNKSRPLPPVRGPEGVPPAAAEALALSLAKFQVGEAGEGRIATQIDRCHWASIDDDYRAALKDFVREEGRHGRILGSMVRSLGKKELSETWTDKLFVFGRRLVGIKHKLLVLLAAEVIGVSVYRAIAAQLGEGDIKDALNQICDDEVAHLQFHLDFFCHDARTPASRLKWRVAWAAVSRAAAACVIADHVRTFRALGIPLTEINARFNELISEVDSGLSYRPKRLRKRRAAAREMFTRSPERMRAV